MPEFPLSLAGQVTLVTGASRGIGRGIALQLGQAGAKVYITGRQPAQKRTQDTENLPTLEAVAKEVRERGGQAVVVYCDHSKDEDVKKLFEQIDAENDGRLDILVNNAYSAVTDLSSASGKKFWELEPTFWDQVNNVGLRNHYICAVYAARLMVARGSGLIVNVSSVGGLQYLFNVAYGVGKTAVDRMAVDMASELRKTGVQMVSLWPGLVKTEKMQEILSDKSKRKIIPGLSEDIVAKSVASGETVEASGRSIVYLACDPNRAQKSGKILLTGDLALEYGFLDVDGTPVANFRTAHRLLALKGWTRLAQWVPEFVRFPHFLIHLGSNKF